MTQEKKELLFKDLSARLPYKVIVDYGYNAFDVRNGNHVKHGSKRILTCDLLDVFMSPRQNEKGEYIKPYLRPMSSMTKEEHHEYDLFFCYGEHDWDNYTIADEVPLVIDWLIAHHFDFRNLIEKGLALEAPEGMYKTK